MHFSVLQLNAVGNLLQVGHGHILIQKYMIYLLFQELRVCKLAGHIAIIGEQKHTGGVAVKASYGINTLRARILYEVHHGLALLRVVACSDIILRLVEQNVNLLLNRYRLIMEFYLIRTQHFGAQFGHNGAVYAHYPCLDKLVGLTARAYTRVGQILVQANRLVGVDVFFLIFDALLKAVFCIGIVARTLSVAALTGLVTALRTTITTLLLTSVAALTGLITALRTTITALTGLVTALRTTVTTLTGLIAAFARLITSLARLVTSILIIIVKTGATVAVLARLIAAFTLLVCTLTGLITAFARLICALTGLVASLFAIVIIAGTYVTALTGLIVSMGLIAAMLGTRLLTSLLKTGSEALGTEAALLGFAASVGAVSTCGMDTGALRATRSCLILSLITRRTCITFAAVFCTLALLLCRVLIFLF